MDKLSVEVGTVTGNVQRKENSTQLHVPQSPELAQAGRQSRRQT